MSFLYLLFLPIRGINNIKIELKGKYLILKTIWIISQFTDKFTSNTSNRYAYIYNYFKQNGYNVKMVTSTFDHGKKSKKIRPENKDIIFINEPGYRSNTSPGRLVSHGIYARNAFKYLKGKVQAQDVILCAIPSNYLAYLISMNLQGIKIFDIHDTWPESFEPLLSSRMKGLFKFPFGKWKEMRTKAVKNSDFLMAESKEYLQIHSNLIGSNIPKHAILLGAEISKYSAIKSNETFVDKNYINVVFAGNLGVNYDLDTILNAVEINAENWRNRKIRFYFFGDGEKKVDIFKSVSKIEGLVYHIKRKEYDEYLSILKSFDIAINSFTLGTNVRYSYKSVDYLLLGLPVINNLPGEFWEDVEQYNLGKNFYAGDVNSFSENLLDLCDLLKNKDSDFINNIKSYSSNYLDRELIYTPLFKFVSNCVTENQND